MSPLSDPERRTLFSIARESIESVLEGRRASFDEAAVTEALRRPAGAFVTIDERGDLRGCIGSVFPDGPLYETVARNAVNAAFRDPRFPPLSAEEYPEVSLEISVMGAVERCTPADVQVGRDGLIVRRGHSAGLLLPQVATEYGWTVEEFLRQTCRKAGLPADAWKSPDCILEKFTAEVFGEVER